MMKDQTKQYAGLVGEAITAACCLGLTIVITAITAITAIGLGFLIHYAILIPFFMVFIGINLWALHRSVKNQVISQTETLSPFGLASIGAAISVLGLFFFGNVWDYKSKPDNRSKC